MKKITLIFYLIFMPLLMFGQVLDEDFEGSLDSNGLPTGWTETGLSSDGIWSVDNASNASSSFFTYPSHTNFAYTNDDSCNCNKSADRLITPSLDLSSLSTVQLTYSLFFSDAITNETVKIEVSTDGGTTWTTEATLSPQSGWRNNQTLDISSYAGQTNVLVSFLFNDDGEWSYGAGIDDVIVQAGPTCDSPTNIQNTSLADTTADFSWDSEAAATTGYNWVVMADGDDPTVDTPVANGSVASGTTTAQVTGLTSQTDYDFYVQSDCTGETSVWSSKFDFTTPCPSIVAPFTETFASSSTPNCWTESGDASWEYNLGTPDYAAADLPDHTNTGGTNYAVMDGSDNGDGDVSTLTSPLIDVSSVTTPALVFYAFSDNTDDAAINILDVEFYDGSSWNNVLNQTTLLGSSWEEFIIDLSTYTITGDIQVRFTVTGNDNGGDTYYNDIVIDDVSVTELPTCFTPDNTQNTAVTTTTADFSWDAETTASAGYNWVVMANGDSPITGTPVKSGSVSTGTTVQITGLMSSTDFDFFVQSDCGNGDLSNWSGKVDFTTLCAPFTLPVCESFDGTPDGSSSDPTIPNCWTFLDPGTGYGYVNDISSAHSAPRAFYMYNSGDSSGDYILSSPEITNVTNGNTRVNFWVDGSSGQDLIIGTITDPNDASTFTAIQTITLTSSNYENYKINIPSGADSYVAFKHGQTGTYDSYYLDDICIEAIPSCIVPENSQVTGVTGTTADFSWDAETTASVGYNWVVMADGDDPTTDTPVDNGSVATGTTSAQAMGLTALTDYDFYVQSDCGATDGLSSWSIKLDFVTGCPASFNAPFFDDVESHSTTTSLGDSECWTTNSDSAYDWNVDGSGSTPSSSTGPSGAYSGTNYFYTEGSSGNTGDEAELISPNVDISSLSSPALKFYYHMYGEFIGTLNVDVYDGSNWNNSVYSITGEQQTSGSDPWKEQLVNLSAYSGVIQVRFRAVSNGNSTDYEGDIAIDDISIDEGPTCYAPTNLSVSNITAYTADLGWDDVNTITPGSWDIEYDVAGFTPTGTPNVTPSPTTTSYNLTGLSPDTDYEFYVRANCGGGDTSTWSGPYSFTTLVSCMEPANLMIDSLDDTSATFSWDAVANATNGYNWVVMADGDDPTTDTPIQNGSVTSGTNTIQITGLSSETDYDFYVQADCGSTDGTSTWLGPEDFRTLCPSISAPFFDDIESHSPTSTFDESECWYTVQTSYDWNISDDDTPSTGTGPNQAYSGTNFFFTEGSSGSAGDVAELYSPLIDVSSLSSPALEFYYHMFNGSAAGDMGELHVDVYDGTSWNNDVMTPLVGGQQVAQGDPWILQAIDLSSYTGIIQVRFRAIRGNDYESDISIDDVNIFDYSCMAPTNITSSNITTTTADFSWTMSPDDTNGYEYIVMLDGETPGVDTPVDTGMLATGITSVSISNLSPGVDYDFYIRTLCSLDSAWSPVEDFTTALPPCDLPTAITNTSVTLTTADFSWTASADETDGYIWIVMADGDDPLVDSPVDDGTVATGVTTVQVSALIPGTNYDFYIQTDCGSGTVSILSNKVDFMTDDYPCTPPSSISNNAISETTAKFTWKINGLETGGYNWALMADGDDPDNDSPLFNGSVGTGVTTVLVTGLTAMTNYDFYVQTVCASEDSGWSTKIDITTLSPCVDPSGITISNITDTEADVSWTENGPATEWEIEYGPTGFSQGSGTVITDDDGTLGETISGLTQVTAYDVYVRAICSAASVSAWVGPETFTTVQPPCSNEPTGVTASNETQTSVDLSWTENGSSVEWEIEYGITGFTQGSGTIVIDDDGVPNTTLTNLTAETVYDVYVRSVCDAGVNSDWSDVQSFTTEDLSIGAEQFEGFEYYPNPVKSTLSLSATFQIEKVVVYNLLGQKVNQLTPNTLTTEVNMDRLSAATYLVSVTIDGQVKTFRIIKE